MSGRLAELVAPSRCGGRFESSPAKRLTWSRPRLVFVNSMSDLVQNGVGDDYVRLVFLEGRAWDGVPFRVVGVEAPGRVERTRRVRRVRM